MRGTYETYYLNCKTASEKRGDDMSYRSGNFGTNNAVKRRAFILSRLLTNSNNFMNVYDLAEALGVSYITINRDLMKMRRAGIKVHSVKKNGVCLIGEPELMPVLKTLGIEKVIAQKLAQYFIKLNL
jgi:biotin operon repressor